MISVVMPSFNRQSVIKKTIQSILDQTYSDFELIVVDDCSSDNTVNVVKSIDDPRVHVYVLEKNSGANKARNFGVERASGKYIAFMDSDDYWHVDKLKKCLDFIKSNKADVVFHSYQRIFPNGKKEILPHYNLNNFKNKKRQILWENCVATPALMGKREVFTETRFDESMPKFQDWDLAIRLVDKYNVQFMDNVLLDANVDNNGLTMNMNKSVTALKKIIQKNKTFFEEDKELAAKYYGLLGDFIDRSKDVNEKSTTYYKISLSEKLDKKIFLKYVLSIMGLNKKVNELRTRFRLTY